MHRTRIAFLFAALLCRAAILLGQTLSSGSVGSIDPNGNVAFSLVFDRVPDFTTLDQANRPAFSFQFYIGTGAVPPVSTTRPMASLIRGDEIHVRGDIVIRNDTPSDPDPNSGGWGTVRGRVSYVLNGRTLTFTVPASVLNVSTRFVCTLELFSYGSTTCSYTGSSGEPILFNAPESIAGKVYRDSASFQQFGSQGRTPIIRDVVTESTIVFESPTRFTYLLDRSGESPPDTDRKTRILPPKPNGQYRFTRTGNNQAVLALQFDDGSSSSLNLAFTSPTTGRGTDVLVNRSFMLADLDAWRTSAARNVSMRGTVGPTRPLVVGFIVPADREVLIRAVGPSLRSFGLTTGWADPDFQLYQGDKLYETGERHAADWSAPTIGPSPGNSAAGVQKVFSYLGAFPLQDASKDAVDIVRLPGGAYTVVCTAGAEDAGGDVLIEVYFLP